MKKVIFVLVFVLMCVYSSANDNILLDYFNENKITDIIRNDTVFIKYSFSEDRFKFVLPDTIWIKRVKRPKENKHYYLKWFKDLEKTHDNSQKNITKCFILRDFFFLEEGEITLQLYDLTHKREYLFTPNNAIEITCKNVAQDIYMLLKDSLIYYKPLKLSKLNEEFYNSTLLNSCQYKKKLTPLIGIQFQ